jgi:hypothetical protein
MNIIQLIRIVTDISDTITASTIGKHYERLIDLCKQGASEGNSASISQQIDEELTLLTTCCKEIGLKSWDRSCLRFFEKLEGPELLSPRTSEDIKDVLSRCPGNCLKVTPILEDNYKRISALMEQLNHLKASLELLVSPSGELGGLVDVEEQNHLLQVYFEEALFLKDINQLEKFCRIWSRILSAFTTLTREDIDEVRIYDIESTSITFYAGVGTLNALSKGIYQMLVHYERVLTIKNLQQELAGLNLMHEEEITALLEEDIAQVVDVTASSAASEFVDKYQWSDSGDDECAAVFGMVQISLKQTLNFVERGGRIISNHSNSLGELNEKIVAMLKKQRDVGSMSAEVVQVDLAMSKR